MTQCYFEIVASLTEQLLQGLTVGDERNNASHQLSSWSGKLSLPTTFPFSPCTGIQDTDVGRVFLSSDHVFIPCRGANRSGNGGKIAQFPRVYHEPARGMWRVRSPRKSFYRKQEQFISTEVQANQTLIMQGGCQLSLQRQSEYHKRLGEGMFFHHRLPKYRNKINEATLKVYFYLHVC